MRARRMWRLDGLSGAVSGFMGRLGRRFHGMIPWCDGSGTSHVPCRQALRPKSRKSCFLHLKSIKEPPCYVNDRRGRVSWSPKRRRARQP